MKLRTLASGLVCLLVLSAKLTAGPILVGELNFGNSGNETQNVGIRGAINTYNALPSADLPQIFGTGATPSLIDGWVELTNQNKTNFHGADEKILNWTAPNTYTEYYLLSKYGSGGANWDTALHYLLSGEQVVYNPGGSGPPQGLSHVRLFARRSVAVPDGAATAGLLGLALVGLSVFARRRQA
jgi:hypothetical protein